MITTESRRGRTALIVGHCAGMVDLVALPVWVGTLVSFYKFDTQQAGLLVTLFLAGAVIASVLLAPRFDRLSGRLVATVGFGISATALLLGASASEFTTLALVHAVAGFAAGSALSVTHGTIARCANPHRTFAIVNFALGVFAVVFLGATAKLIAVTAGASLFLVLSAVMAIGALVAFVAFPAVPPARGRGISSVAAEPARSTTAVWAAVMVICLMGLMQSMTFAFLERVGAHSGYSAAMIMGVFVVLGFVNLLPAPIAAWLETRISARKVMLAGPVLQALVCAFIMNSTTFGVYSSAASVFASIILFTHTFAFGLVAKIEPTGRALAATPAMLMTGAAIGPILGGTLVKVAGYSAISVAAGVFALCAVAAMLLWIPADRETMLVDQPST